MKETRSSLYGLNYNRVRRDGNSTRAIDNAIQIIFQGYRCEAKDPYRDGSHREANRNLFGRILDRLNTEHRSVKYVIDRNKLTIELDTDSDVKET